MSREMRRVAVVLGGIVLLFCLMLMSDCGDTPSDNRKPDVDKPENSGRGMRAAGLEGAKMYLTPVLKAPSTADYPWDTVSAIRLPDVPGMPPRWSVTGAVDADNSFGVRLRMQWETIVCDIPGKDIAISKVSLDGEVVYENANYARRMRGKQ
jgi:hypothetical protein